MIRKAVIAIAITTAIGAAVALAPTIASARGGGGGHGGGGHGGGGHGGGGHGGGFGGHGGGFGGGGGFRGGGFGGWQGWGIARWFDRQFPRRDWWIPWPRVCWRFPWS